MLDKNKNGEIDKTEQEEAMKNIHSMTLPKARWAWSAMDTDGDGKISESEFLKGMQAICMKAGEKQLLDSIIRTWPNHPTARNKDGETALHLAAKDGDAAACEALLARGADPGARGPRSRRGNRGVTALSLAEHALHAEVAALLQGAA